MGTAAQFLSLTSIDDLASLLGVQTYKLIKILYEVPDSRKYKGFNLKKKGGGHRKIAAPGPFLFSLQSTLATVLNDVYGGRPPAHGFIPGKSIVSNASGHVGKRWVLNVDLKEFFPSIHYGRVRGLLMAQPYGLPRVVAGHVARLCCYRGRLPQGAPTSPVISNMICSRLDSALRQLAKAQRSQYTRYADDITFSTSKSQFPRDLAFLDDLGQLHLGDKLREVLESNGFEHNEKKLRLQHRGARQEVTGLVVNKLTNVPRSHVRQIRAMLHAWEKYGETAAEKEFHAKYDRRQRWPGARPPSFRLVVQGKLEFVRMVKPRGSRDPVYRRYRDKLLELAPELARADDAPGLVPLVIFTEGKTDVKHIRSALKRFQEKGDFEGLDLEFHEEENIDGSSQLLTYCTNAAKRDPSDRIVCVFDRDEPKILKQVIGRNVEYRKWRDDVYSLALPIPSHRTLDPDISIELLYHDNELKTPDINGRRIFLSNEFNVPSGRLKADPSISTTNGSIKSGFNKVIDGDVYNEQGDSIALTKDALARYIEEDEPGFENFNIDGFRPLFELLVTLAKE